MISLSLLQLDSVMLGNVMLYVFKLNSAKWALQYYFTNIHLWDCWYYLCKCWGSASSLTSQTYNVDSHKNSPIHISRHSQSLNNCSSIHCLWNGNKPLLMLSSCPVKTNSLAFQTHSNIVAANAREEPMRKLNSNWRERRSRPKATH